MADHYLHVGRRLLGTEIDVLPEKWIRIENYHGRMEYVFGNFQRDRFLENESRIISGVVQARIRTHRLHR
jgi:hypothetical protein